MCERQMHRKSREINVFHASQFSPEQVLTMRRNIYLYFRILLIFLFFNVGS